MASGMRSLDAMECASLLALLKRRQALLLTHIFENKLGARSAESAGHTSPGWSEAEPWVSENRT